MSFAVLGAGVVGFSTALELQDKYANAKVTIIADKFGADTTSDVAAGIFRPGPSFSGPNDAITKFVFIFHLIYTHFYCGECRRRRHRIDQ